MRTAAIFDPRQEDLDRLVSDYPFALVISAAGSKVTATPLPLLMERDPSGRATLIGHFARSNPHVELLRREPWAVAAFMGVNGYISPSWFRDRTQAPTWNYETVHFEMRVEFATDQEATRPVLERLVAAVERGRANPWSISDMGARYERLAAAVVPFRAEVTATHGKFKLGQNERIDVLEDAIAGLEHDGRTELAAAMRQANAERMRSE
jgi:transcriptional regulator